MLNRIGLACDCCDLTNSATEILNFSSIFSHETARNSRKVGSYTDSWPQLACSARLCHYRRRPLRRPHLVDIQPQIVKIEKTLLLKTKKDTEKKESYHRVCSSFSEDIVFLPISIQPLLLLNPLKSPEIRKTATKLSENHVIFRLYF